MSTDSCSFMVSLPSPSLGLTSAPLYSKSSEKKRRSRSLRTEPVVRDDYKSLDWEGRLSAINKELIKQGYPPLVKNERGLLATDETGYSVLYHTLSLLLDDLKRKDLIINHFTSSSLSDNALPTSDETPTIDSLQKLVTELQYNNAKLRVDVMNRPHVAELKACQQRVTELEAELKQYRNHTRCDQTDIHNAVEHLKDIGAILKVNQITDIIPQLLSLQSDLEKYKDIEPYLNTVATTIGSSSHSNHLCPTLWSSASKTIKNWKEEIDELKGLQLIFNDLIHSIENGRKSEDVTCKSPSKRRGRRSVTLSCKQMKDILQSWLHYIDNQKDAQMGAVLDMIHHFQRLFDVQSLGGVYVAMTTAYRQLNEAHTAYRQLTKLVERPGCPWQQLVFLIERLSECKEKGLYVRLCEEYGELNNEQIIDALSLSSKFVPVFYKMACVLQELLGVESLSAIIPAVRRLSYSNNK